MLRHTSRIAEAVVGRAVSARWRVLAGAACAVLVLLGAWVVHAGGGTRNAWPHLLYLPVLIAGWAFGPAGGTLAGVAAGLAVGPFMPLDVTAGEPQSTSGWLYRTGFFVLVGGVSGGLNQRLRHQLAAAERARRRFSSLVRHAPDLVVVADAEGRVAFASPSVAVVLGHEPDEVDRMPFVELVHPHDRARARRLLSPLADGVSRGEVRVRHADGSWRHVELVASVVRDDPGFGAVVLNGRDVTERLTMEAELRHQAWHDLATGLANRQRFTEALRAALADPRTSPRAEPRAEPRAGPRTGPHTEPGGVAVLLVSLSRFRVIQETLGQDTAGQLVNALGQRLARLVRPGDLLARYETSEFAVLCRDVAGPEDARRTALRLRQACDEDFLLVTGEVRIAAAVGVAMARDAAGDPVQLVSDAYTAVRHAREGPPPHVAVFEPAWRKEAAQAVRTETALHAALERGELQLDYQPIIDLRTGRTVEVEALLRWNHPRLGRVPPSDFIPIAERTGLIVPIGRWVLHEACAQLAAWRREPSLAGLRVAVNLSARQLDTADLADDVRDALRRNGLPPDALTLELTETGLIGDAEHTLEALIAIRGLGVRLAVDDFGTGYSSLGYLKQLPVDSLKIDRLFVTQLTTSDHDDAIVGAVIGLARSLGLDTVAEGVESQGQANRLVELGCEHAQGYLYSPPVPPAQLRALVQRSPLHS